MPGYSVKLWSTFFSFYCNSDILEISKPHAKIYTSRLEAMAQWNTKKNPKVENLVGLSLYDARRTDYSPKKSKVF